MVLDRLICKEVGTGIVQEALVKVLEKVAAEHQRNNHLVDLPDEFLLVNIFAFADLCLCSQEVESFVAISKCRFLGIAFGLNGGGIDLVVSWSHCQRGDRWYNCENNTEVILMVYVDYIHHGIHFSIDVTSCSLSRYLIDVAVAEQDVGGVLRTDRDEGHDYLPH